MNASVRFALVLLSCCCLASTASAQALRNTVERARDRAEIRDDRKERVDDHGDLALLQHALTDLRAAHGDASAVRAVDTRVAALIEREVAEHAEELGDARREVRAGSREIRRDRCDDQRDLEAEREQGARMAAMAKLWKDQLVGQYDPSALKAREAILLEWIAAAEAEIVAGDVELREDHHETREDRRQRD